MSWVIYKKGTSWRPGLEDLVATELSALATEVAAECRRRELVLSENNEARLQDMENALYRQYDVMRSRIERENDYQNAEAMATLWTERALALSRDAAGLGEAADVALIQAWVAAARDLLKLLRSSKSAVKVGSRDVQVLSGFRVGPQSALYNGVMTVGTTPNLWKERREGNPDHLTWLPAFGDPEPTPAASPESLGPAPEPPSWDDLP